MVRPHALELWGWTTASLGLGDSPKTECVALAEPSTTFEGSFSDNFSGSPVSNENKTNIYKGGKNEKNVLVLFEFFHLYDQDPTSHFSWSLYNLFDAIQVSPKATIHLTVKFLLIIYICVKLL